MNTKIALAMNCTGSSSPDIRGHFRNPKQAQQKHHWWWTANMIFENVLNPIREYEGVVVFLNDNIYILKDFLYMLLYMNKISHNLGNCEFLTLERATFSNLANVNGLELITWDPNYEPSVLAFDMNVWNKIISNYDIFCTVDDYSWARSLLYVSLKQKEGSQFKIMSSMFPRAYKTDSCEFNRILKHCDVIESVYHILQLQRKLKESLFPTQLEVYVYIQNEDDSLVNDYSEGYGGWNDPRDMDLCENFTLSKIKKIVMEMRN
ncbi:unnamed protein product [Diatraea saccharalis]|uniref:Uncharacterized protein n=1 Tax=Diatraea saccharalis TaxID=40085 RepID=A0A9N9WJ57_9NEOP|nr:unnamed protein product [Diatraea saccharalis]